MERNEEDAWMAPPPSPAVFSENEDLEIKEKEVEEFR